MDEMRRDDNIERRLDTAFAEGDQRCEYDIESSLTDNRQPNAIPREFCSSDALSTENLIPIIDHPRSSSIGLFQGRSQICRQYWIEIVCCSFVGALIIMILIAGIVLATFPPLKPNIGCNVPSGLGKSCSTKNLKTILLVRPQRMTENQYIRFTRTYTSQSKRGIITFNFPEGSHYYLGNVSIWDTVDNVDLIEDGGFESGTLTTYCVCDDSSSPTKLTKDSSGYVYEADTFFAPATLSQPVNTIEGRNYSVSFWLKADIFSKRGSVSVYMSTANNIRKLSSMFILTKWIFIWLFSIL